MAEIDKTAPIEKVGKKSSKIIPLVLLVLIVLNFVAVKFYSPVAPHISVKSESLIFEVVDGEIEELPWFRLPFLGDVYLTNSMLALIPIWLIIIWLAFEVRKQTKDGQVQSHGVVLIIESVMSLLYGMADSAVEKKYRKIIYPYFMGIFFYVAIANLSKLIPIFETFGFVVPVGADGFVAQKWTSWFYAITSEGAQEGGYKLVSLLRGAPTDLNCTLAIALFAVIAIQIVGVKAKGIGYFNRFINIRAVIHKLPMGLIDFLVGILELVAEFAKIASFGFRLFGNMFAGMVLLLFLGYMIPWMVSSVIMLYEVFVGILQAFIFGMLTTVFMGMAVREEGEQ